MLHYLLFYVATHSGDVYTTDRHSTMVGGALQELRSLYSLWQSFFQCYGQVSGVPGNGDYPGVWRWSW